MPKVKLESLVEGEIFRFNEKTAEHTLVSFSGDFVICRNVVTGETFDVIKYLKVYTPPYQFYKQLSLF